MAYQDDGKSNIDGIAAEGKATGRDELVGVLLIDANPKAASKGNQGPEKKRQSCQAEEHTGPGNGLGVEEYLRAYAWPMERRRKNKVKIKQRKRWDEEIGFVDFAKLHSRDALSLQQEGSGHYHPQHEHNGQDCEICWHTDYSLGFYGWNDFAVWSGKRIKKLDRVKIRNHQKSLDDYSSLSSSPKSCPIRYLTS